MSNPKASLSSTPELLSESDFGAWSTQTDVTVRLLNTPSRVLARVGAAVVCYDFHRHLIQYVHRVRVPIVD